MAEYEVERIVGKRFRRGELQYLVKWVGYPEEENTWEPEKHCSHCPELIKQFQEQQNAARSHTRIVNSGTRRATSSGQRSTSRQRSVNRRRRTAQDMVNDAQERLQNLSFDNISNVENVTNDVFNVQIPQEENGQAARNDEEINLDARNITNDRSSAHLPLQNENGEVARSNDEEISLNARDTTYDMSSYQLPSQKENDRISRSSVEGDLNMRDVTENGISVQLENRRNSRCSNVENESNEFSIINEDSITGRRPSEVEIVGAQPSDNGIKIGVKLKNERKIFTFSSKEVLDWWPSLLVEFYENHIIFTEITEEAIHS